MVQLRGVDKVTMNVGDMLQLIDKQILDGQNLFNIYHYRVVSINDAATDLIDLYNQFVLNVLPTIIEVQSFDLTHVEIMVNNLTNGIDFYQDAISVDGLVTASVDDAFTAYGVRLNRTNGVTRSGQKRIGGVPESGVQNSLLLAPFLSSVQLMANAFCDFQRAGVGPVYDAVWRPVIIGRTSTGAYDLTRWQPFDTATANPYVSSQVSRKAR